MPVAYNSRSKCTARLLATDFCTIEPRCEKHLSKASSCCLGFPSIALSNPSMFSQSQPQATYKVIQWFHCMSMANPTVHDVHDGAWLNPTPAVKTSNICTGCHWKTNENSIQLYPTQLLICTCSRFKCNKTCRNITTSEFSDFCESFPGCGLVLRIPLCRQQGSQGCQCNCFKLGEVDPSFIFGLICKHATACIGMSFV